MNKQRRHHRSPKKEYVETKLLYVKGKKFNDVKNEKFNFDATRNRSCYFSPDTRDAAQLTDSTQNFPQNKWLQRTKQAACKSKIDIQTCGLTDTLNAGEASTDIRPPFVRNAYISDSRQEFGVADVKKSLSCKEVTNEATGKASRTLSACPKNVYISQEPRVRVIAEKFARYKMNNVEVRKLEARIACMEYDVFHSGKENQKPIQTLRAYFSVTPVSDKEKEISSENTEENYVADDIIGDNDKGIEIIDANIPENKPLLEGLKRVLKNKQTKIKNNKTLDTMYLYQMAKRDLINDCTYTDFLSKAELDEIKELIVKKTTSSAHGISRRKLRDDNNPNKKSEFGIKDDLINDLFRFI